MEDASNFSKRPKKDNKKIIIAGILAAIILITGITYLFVLFNGGNADNGGKITDTDAASTGADTDNALPGGEQGASNPDGITSDSTSSEETAADITVPIVEVAPVDDKEDPQSEQTQGVEVDVSKISVADKNAEVITYGIDVAKWQGVIDWKQVKASGVDFAMVRVGYRTQVDGEIYEDPYAKYNLQQAKANGIKIGVYFFSTAITEKEAREEAKWVSGYIAPYPITYPVAYNCEGFSDPDNRQNGLSSSTRTDIAIAFLDYVEGQGYTPMFYAAKNELEQNAQWDTDRLSSKYKIWVAQYPIEPYTSSSKSTYTGEHGMWQFTSKGEVKGIDKAVDINIAYFGYDKTAEAKDDTPQEQVSADPAALINFIEVNETVTAKEVTNLRTVPSTSDPDTIAEVLKNGDTAKRIGIGDNGWSKVTYKGKTLYAVSSYLTTDLTAKAPTPTPTQAPAGSSFKKVDEQVTAKEQTNLRSEPNSQSADTVVGVLKYGDVATRTGISDNGWSRVEYDGETLYAVSSYLTTDLNYKEKNTPTEDNPEAGITFTDVNENVTAKDVTNLRKVPSSASPDTIVTALHNGEVAVRTGVGNNGWSRVEYNGQILYAISSYLETTGN
ncbi:MAG TPA: SH3 domain-containing protein [Clostridiales bacterium]|nr:SH3 domain-containing protein [Clostridiales bacterium]